MSNTISISEKDLLVNTFFNNHTMLGTGGELTIKSSVEIPKSEAIKYDQNKTDWSLMPFECVEEITKVLDFGAKKYSAHNWREGGGFKYSRVLNSLLRHVFSYIRGEDRDPESGLSHLAHAGCNIIFLLYYERYKARYSNDDRVKE
jgi:hypothetical protein